MSAFACRQAKATPTTQAAAAEQDSSGGTSECCPCCPCDSASPTSPTGKPAPAQKPPAPTKSFCSCSDLHAVMPDTSSVEQEHSGFVLTLPPLTAGARGVGSPAAVVGTHLPPPTRTLHVWNCVWLC